MGYVFSLMLGLSLAGGATCLLVLASGVLLRKTLRSSWLTYLWLVVLLCFIVPVPLNLPFTSDGFRTVSAAISSAMTTQEQPTVPPAADDPALAVAENGDATLSASAVNGNAAAPDAAAGINDAGGKQLTASVLRLLPYVWITGAAAMVVWTVTGYVLTLRRLRKGRTLLSLSRVPVYESRFISTPILAGLIKPSIYLPKDFEYSELAIRHERAHLRRGDIWLKWLVQLTVCIHWFNPLAWLMKQELNRLIELSCDKAVVRRLDEADRRTYSIMLLDTAEAVNDRSGMLVASLGKDRRILQQRLKEIMKFKKASPKAVAAMTVLAVIITCAAVVFGALFTGCAKPPDAAKEGDVTPAVTETTPSASPAQSASASAFNSPEISAASPSGSVMTAICIVTNIIDDLLFDNDPAVIGTWQPVGNADNIASFVPENTPASSVTGTWDLVIDKDYTRGMYAYYTQRSGYQTQHYPNWDFAVSYEMKEIDGRTFLFIEEKDSDDLTGYIIFEKLSDTSPVHTFRADMPGTVIIITHVS